MFLFLHAVPFQAIKDTTIFLPSLSLFLSLFLSLCCAEESRSEIKKFYPFERGRDSLRVERNCFSGFHPSLFVQHSLVLLLTLFSSEDEIERKILSEFYFFKNPLFQKRFIYNLFSSEKWDKISADREERKMNGRDFLDQS